MMSQTLPGTAASLCPKQLLIKRIVDNAHDDGAVQSQRHRNATVVVPGDEVVGAVNGIHNEGVSCANGLPLCALFSDEGCIRNQLGQVGK